MPPSSPESNRAASATATPSAVPESGSRVFPAAAPSSEAVETFRARFSTLPLTQAEQRFLQDVVLRETPALSPNVTITRRTTSDGSPILNISHHSTINGKELHFRYAVNFTDQARPKTPPITSLTDVNEIHMPKGDSASAEDLYHMRCAWRRVTIADPLLYATHANKSVEMREYQGEAIEAGFAAIQRGEHPLLQMFTGTGKTYTGYHLMERQLEELRRTEAPVGKVIFLVNNQTILGEAEEALHRVFPKYKGHTSQCYEGTLDFSGDVIFATPGTLKGENLAKLLAEHNISVLISDETHHLPADTNRQIYSMIEEDAGSHGARLAIIGLTATPIRPDQKTVVGFYSGSVAFRYDYHRAWYEGYVPAIQHHADDLDMPSHGGENATAPILPGTPQYEAHLQERYDPSRDDHIVDRYRFRIKDKVDPRALVLTHSQEAAIRITAKFNSGNPPIAATYLTSERKMSDPEGFQADYEAFKSGSYRDGRPGPKVVVSVDQFKEGIDIPGIGLVLFHRDTTSSIVITQGIGRGDRPAPGKTHLDVSDLVGLYRKLEFLQYLAQMSQPSEERSAGDKDDRDQGDERSLIAAAVEHVGDTNVTKVLQSYLDDLPGALDALYGAYLRIPRHEKTHLSEFFERTLLREGVEFPNDSFASYVKTLADDLASLDPSDVKYRRAVSILRNGIDPCFTYSDINSHSSTGDLLVTNTTRIIYSHWVSLLTEANATLPVNALLKVFPEFGPEYEASLLRVANNLRTVRADLFQLSQRGMSVELVEKVLNNPHIDLSRSSTARGFLSMDRECLAIGDDYTLVKAAEGHRVEHARSVSAGGTASNHELQGALIDAYLLHPKLSKHLKREDFDLNANDFKGKLIELGLMPAVEMNTTKLDRAIRAHVTQFDKMFENGGAPNPEIVCSITQFFSSENTRNFFGRVISDEYFINQSIANTLLKFRDSIVNHQRASGAEFAKELLPALDRVLELAVIRVEKKIPELGGLAVVLTRKSSSKRDEADYYIDVDDPKQSDNSQSLREDSTRLLGKLRRDKLGRYNFIFEKHVSITESKPSALECKHDQVGQTGKRLITEATIGVLQTLGAMYDETFTLFVPTDKEGRTVFSLLMDSALQQTDWSVVGQVDGLTLTTHSQVTLGSIPGLARSRLDLTIEELAGYRVGAMSSISRLYSALYIYRQDVEPRWPQIHKKLIDHASNATDGSAERYLVRALESQIQQQLSSDMIVRLRSQFDLLERGSKDLQHREIVLVAMDQILSGSGAGTIATFPRPEGRGEAARNIDPRYTVQNPLIKTLGRYSLSLVERVNCATEIDRKFMTFFEKCIEVWGRTGNLPVGFLAEAQELMDELGTPKAIT